VRPALFVNRERLAAEPGRPSPADQRVAGHVRQDLLQRPAAVARRILDLRADLADRLILPSHLPGRQVPVRMARHAGGIEIRALVAGGAAHRRCAKAIGAAFDRRLMQSACFALERAIADRVAVHAARSHQHFAGFREQSRRPRRRVTDPGKALRRRQCDRRPRGMDGRRRCQDQRCQQRSKRRQALG
jgi:hypothetical protein